MYAVTLNLTDQHFIDLEPLLGPDDSRAGLLPNHYDRESSEVEPGRRCRMPAFPGLIRAKELHTRPSGERTSLVEAPSKMVERKARVDSPYFRSDSNGEDALQSLAERAKAVGARIVHAARSPRLHSREASVSPPHLERSSGFAAIEVPFADNLASFEDLRMAVRSSSIQASQLSARDGTKAKNIDMLLVSEPKLRRSATDDNSSNFSAETRVSGSTTSQKRGTDTTCGYCKSPGHANMPLIKCSTCPNRFHDIVQCLNPKTCKVDQIDASGREKSIRCMQCVSKGKSRAVGSVPSAGVASVLLPTANHPPSKPDAHKKTSWPVTLEPWQDIPTNAGTQTQQRGYHNINQGVQADPDERKFLDHPSCSPTGSDAFRHIDKITTQDNKYTKSVDMSKVPKGPAAMRKAPSPESQEMPRTNRLLDSYRPDPSATLIDARGIDSYRPFKRSRPTPAMRSEEDRETFLRHAPKAERDHYLQQNRTAICKEITCPHWLSHDCRHAAKCVYAHKDTRLYFPTPNRPSKEWTCYFWMFDIMGCHLHEEECTLAHYDTGIYADRRGLASTKHITCFYWDKTNFCSKGTECLFAHRHTGIESEGPASLRNTASFDRKSYPHRPQTPVRGIADSRQPQSSLSKSPTSLMKSSPPPIRETPLSPLIEPSDSESEPYEPPSVKPTPPGNIDTLPHVTSTDPMLPQVSSEPSSTVAPLTPVTATHIESSAVGIQPAVIDALRPLIAFEDSEKDATPREAPQDTITPIVALPKQYARRTGGVKLSRTSDPRRRKLETANIDSQHKTKGEKRGVEKSEVPITSTKLNKDLLPVESSSLLKCQICQKLILANQAASHKCQRVVNDQAASSEQASGEQASPWEPSTIDPLQTSHSRINGLSRTDYISQLIQLDVATGSNEMGHMFSKEATDSSLSRSTFPVPKRTASGSEVDAMFISNKKRKTGSRTVMRAVTSDSSSGAAPASGVGSSKPDSIIDAQLSISDLTELETLRKEFDTNAEERLLDDDVILKLLRAKKRKKLASAIVARAEAEAAQEEVRAAEIKAKRRAEREQKDKDEAAEIAAEAAENAERERNRELRKQRERIRAQTRSFIEPPDEDTDPSEAPSGLEVPARFRQYSKARNSLSTARGVETAPSVSNNTIKSPHPDFDKLSGKRKLHEDNDFESAGFASTTAPIVTPQEDDSSDLASALSAGQDITHEEMRIEDTPRSFRQGPQQIACGLCRVRKIECRHYDEAVEGDVLQQQTALPRHIDGDRSSWRETGSIKPEPSSWVVPLIGEQALKHHPHIRACMSCQNSRTKCCHDPVTGVVDPARVERIRQEELAPRRKRQSISLEPPQKSVTPLCSSRDPIYSSVGASISVVKTASSVWAQRPSSTAHEEIANSPDAEGKFTPDVTIINRSNSKRSSVEPANLTGMRLGHQAFLKTGPEASQEEDKDATTRQSTSNKNLAVQQIDDDGHPRCHNCNIATFKRLRRWKSTDYRLCDPCYMHLYFHGVDKPIDHQSIALSCGNCGIPPPKRLRKANQKEKLLCDRCYMYHSRTGADRPLDQTEESEDVITDDSFTSDTNLLRPKYKPGVGFTYYLAAKNKCLTVHCIYCGWKQTQNSTLEKRHRRECSKARPWKGVDAIATSLSADRLHTRAYKDTWNDAGRGEDTYKASDSTSIAAGLKAAKALASEAALTASTTAPDSIAPDEIQALFCQPPPRSVNTDRGTDQAFALSVHDHDTGYGDMRLVQSKILDEEETAAAIASMRADGIEVISLDSDSDSSQGGHDVYPSASWPLEPVSLVQSGRYEREPDPRRWIDEDEDHKSHTFNNRAVQMKIAARPGLKANIQARKNGTKPGKLLAMSDWQERIRKYGNVHRETDRNPGPQRKGTFVREVADRSKLTIPRGFDDQEVMREEVQGTMQEFLGLPRQMKYDLIGAPRLVAARTLAFSDATGRERVPDKEKFPVGMGG